MALTTSYTDSGWAVAGEVEIYNPDPGSPAIITGVTDVVYGDDDQVVAIELDCGDITFPYSLAPGGFLKCSYGLDLLEGSSGVNRAEASTSSESKVGGGWGEVDFKFDVPTALIDECVEVRDDKYGPLRSFCFDNLLLSEKYSLLLGPYAARGQYEFTNAASFVTGDNEYTGESSWTVTIDVPCEGGCTRTIGYWSTHAGFSGNNPDLVTPLLPILLGEPGGEKSVQVDTAAQAVAILELSGDASNGINKLYAQLLGARLNIKNGASDGAISATILAADAFLAGHEAADWEALSGAEKDAVLEWMETLDGYNNGLIGPGQCSD